MPDDEKDKYDELEELPSPEEIEASLEELPVDELPEPLGERTEPMDNLIEQAKAGREPAPKPETADTGSDLGKKIEAAAKVRDASEYLRGQKQVKVIKKSAIKGIVDEIINAYSGIEHKDLLSKIAEYEFNLSNLKQEKQVLIEDLEHLRKEQQSFQDEAAIKYEKEIEELRMRLATAEELLSHDSSKEKVAKLEEEVVCLRQRVQELEKGLEFAATIEEYDYGMAMEATTEDGQKATKIGELLNKTLENDPERRDLAELKKVIGALGKRYEFMTEIFKESRMSYSDALKKVEERQGAVEVVAELVRLNARNRGWDKELSIWKDFLQTAESIAMKK